MNKRGQFSIIAALLVAVILITTVVATYSAIRNSPVQNESPILSAIDETNLAIKQVLGFTVGYYGSVLQVTGNSPYAKTLATNYLQSGMQNIVSTHPEWGTSLNVKDSSLQTYWFMNASYSNGNLTVSYDLAGVGITGVNYQTSCRLSVQIVASPNGQACLNVTADENEPLVTLGKQNFNFYRYNNPNSTWEFANPSNDPTAYANGTYSIDIPSGINPYSYVVQVQDQRGIIVVASSFNSYTCGLTWNSTSVQTGSPATQNYVDNDTSDVDSSPDKGAHSSFPTQKNTDGVYDNLTEGNFPMVSGDTSQFVQNNTSDIDGNGNIGTASNFTTEQYNDGVLDTLTEADTNNSSPEKYSYFNNNGGVWTNPANAYDNNIGTAATYTWSNPGGYTAYLTLNLTYVTRGSKIRYLVGRSNTAVTNMTIDIANQTGSWLNVYNATPTYGAYANASIMFSQYTAVRFSFYKPGTTSRTVYVNETQCINDTVLANYQLDLERRWTSAPYNVNGTKLLCIKTGTLNAEALEVDAWTGSWTVINSSLVPNAWNNISVSSYLTAADFVIRFIDGTRSGDTAQSSWQIDAVLLYTWNITNNYRLDLEERWTNANYTNAKLCIKTGSFSGAETIAVDAWNGSAWINVLGSMNANSWNNATVSAYLQPSNFTIRFKGTNENSDPTQDSWQIDAAFLAVWPTADLYSLSRQGTIDVELLQNGTMRWNGQNLILTNSTSIPFPPVPVKSIHVNQTINGMNSEVPFQVEDWSSAYRIPLGLTSNTSIFSSRTMLVFLATPNASKTTIWWNGSDTASQTSLAYTNRYFNDSPSSGKISNGFTTLQFQSNFVVTSTVGTSTSTANFMRINNDASTYGSHLAYVITNGTVRDIIHQEPEWSNGAPNSSDIYSDVVLTLPANTTYYTYQLRLMFVQSQQNRTISDLCPIWLTSLTGQQQTENGTLNGLPTVSNATDLFYNYSASSSAHHWSQSISGTKGAGIMFTDSANQNLYIFDSISGTKTGALLSNSTAGTIQLLPVVKSQLNFNTTLDSRMQDIIWCGAVATFDTTTPIYNNSDQTGLWIIFEYPPTATVTTENYQ